MLLSYIYDVMDLKLIKTVKVRWKNLDMFEPEADGYVEKDRKTLRTKSILSRCLDNTV